MPWNPDECPQFQTQCSAPFSNLPVLVNIRSNLRVIGLACGTGQLAAQLARALPEGQVTGVDSSPHMLERASESPVCYPFKRPLISAGKPG